MRDGDTEAAAAAVCQAIAVARRGGEEHHRYLAAARETALRYSKEATLAALGEMLRGIAGVGTAPGRRYDLGWRGTLAALRVLYDHDRLGWPGRALSWLSRATKRFRTFASVPVVKAELAAPAPGGAGQ